MTFKARYRTGSDTEYQPLSEHLEETGMYVELFAKKIGLPKPALLTALVHDLGKFSRIWQRHLEKSHKEGKKDKKVDHATAGGQYLYEAVKEKFGDAGELIGQLLAACVMYHHRHGLPDVIETNGTSQLYNRLLKDREETNVDESIANLDYEIKQKIEALLADPAFISETRETLNRLMDAPVQDLRYFSLGLTARFLSACLIAGDRLSSAGFDRGIPVRREDAAVQADWEALRKRLETHLAGLPVEGNINAIRREVSERCAAFAEQGNGIYTLTAATGAGKTFASLRYALILAERTGKDHIFIIAPYTSILDQNADTIRNILDPHGENGRIVLEHHSNLEQSEKTAYFIDASETWNTPIIITTMVQFLEALFGSGTQKIRRMHQLANSVILFDEVQTLPVSCTYLFTWAVLYLYRKANASFLLCTATQPGLDRLEPDYALPGSHEIIPDIAKHFEDLKRVELVDKTKPEGWTLDEAADLIEKIEKQSVLTVVNTKAQARKLYASLLKKHPDWRVFHLSANMCPAHRRREIKQLENYLQAKTEKCVCISTRLIEAGVDIDFDCAIRFLAGFDSIVQTAGRCNRNGALKDSLGKTYIINIQESEERIASLRDLRLGQDVMRRILREFHDDESKYNRDLLHPDLIARYFDYYYGELSELLLKQKTDENNTVLDLLSANAQSRAEYKRNASAAPLTPFRQSFATAWNTFAVISQDTTGVIVPFEKGAGIIAELYALPDPQRCRELLRSAQSYSINIYSSELPKLAGGKIKKIPLNTDMEIYTLDEKYYDQAIGLIDDAEKMSHPNT